MTAAQLARAIFTNSVGGDSSADGPFEVLADTEESDGPEIDPELGLADYWMCFKCRNRQNNPMYPFCERCFTVGSIFDFNLYLSIFIYSINFLFRPEKSTIQQGQSRNCAKLAQVPPSCNRRSGLGVPPSVTPRPSRSTQHHLASTRTPTTTRRWRAPHRPI